MRGRLRLAFRAWARATCAASLASASLGAVAGPAATPASAVAGKGATHDTTHSATHSATHIARDSAKDSATPAALADLGLAMLRAADTTNAVASPVAVAVALGMVHAGVQGAAEGEIEALFGGRPNWPNWPMGPSGQNGQSRPSGPSGISLRLPALLQQLQPPAPRAGTGAENGAPLQWVMAGRVWMDAALAPAIPAAYTERLARRYGADAARLSLGHSEAAREQINRWTAEKTAGRIGELMPPGSVTEATLLTLTTALHFRSPWQQAFDAARTEPRSFHLAQGQARPVPTLNDERNVLQALVNGTLVLALPFADGSYTLLLAQPAEDSSLGELLHGLNGPGLARWQAALQARRCALALPKLALAPKAGALRPVLQSLGVKTVFTAAADLRPMLGAQARTAQLGEIFHAAGLQIDEAGGEAVVAAAATVQGKSLALPAPPCAVNRPFLLAVLHSATGTPLLMGRVGDPSLID